MQTEPDQLRHRYRNQKCRSKLPEPTSNDRPPSAPAAVMSISIGVTASYARKRSRPFVRAGVAREYTNRKVCSKVPTQLSTKPGGLHGIVGVSEHQYGNCRRHPNKPLWHRHSTAQQTGMDLLRAGQTAARSSYRPAGMAGGGCERT